MGQYYAFDFNFFNGVEEKRTYINLEEENHEIVLLVSNKRFTVSGSVNKIFVKNIDLWFS